MPSDSHINHNDPWRDNREGGPPDLDKLLKNWQEKMRKILGAGGAGSGRTGGNSLGPSKTSFFFIGIVLLLAWGLSGIFIVRPAEKSAIFRFGKYATTVGPGPHWIARFIETKQTVNVDQIKTSRHSAHMLTKDNTIVSVELAVQYRVGILKDYLLNVQNPTGSLQQATDSAMRQVIGHSTLDQILTSGREEIRLAIKQQIEKIIDRYKAGIVVVDVPMQPAKAPEAVKAAFDDAIKAQEDQQKSINKADAYAKRIVPLAEGRAKRILAEAKAYKEKVILKAKGDVDKFLALLPEYNRAAMVTRTRIYLDTMQNILGQVNKVVIDSKAANNLLYLPLDKLTSSVKTAPTDTSLKQDYTTPLASATNSYQVPTIASRSPRGRDLSRFDSTRDRRNGS